MENREQEIDPHVDILGATRQAIEEITKAGFFRLKHLEDDYRGTAAGLESTDPGFVVWFLRDKRGGLWCDFHVETIPIKDPRFPDAGRKFNLKDVLEVVLGEYDYLPNFKGWYDETAGFIDMIKAYTSTLSWKYKWKRIEQAFDATHRTDTVKRISRQTSMSTHAYSVRALTHDFSFLITTMRYDESASRVSLLDMKSEAGIGIRFWYEGQTARCVVCLEGTPDATFSIDDVFEAIVGKTIDAENNWLFSLSDSVSRAIVEVWSSIKLAFHEHREETIEHIRAIRQMKKTGLATRLPKYRTKQKLGTFDQDGNPLDTTQELLAERGPIWMRWTHEGRLQ